MLADAYNFVSELVKIGFKFCHAKQFIKKMHRKTKPFPSVKSRIKSVFVTSFLTVCQVR